ncbi:hypothetical protein Adi01nite_33660 [Amorphoplanes digitatis]|nr:hypothetical protein Adi01nite_33660 [Actinoplanes digitatis]
MQAVPPSWLLTASTIFWRLGAAAAGLAIMLRLPTATMVAASTLRPSRRRAGDWVAECRNIVGSFRGADFEELRTGRFNGAVE